MSECLITRLKTSVNDDSLQYFDTAVFKIAVLTDGYHCNFDIGANENGIVLLWNDTDVIFTINDEVISSPYTIKNTSVKIVVDNTTDSVLNLYIRNISNVNSFANLKSVGSDSYLTSTFVEPIDFNCFSNSNIRGISSTNVYGIGEISTIFKNSQNLRTFALYGPLITGLISDIPVKDITRIDVYGTSVTGALEDVVKKCREYGRTTGEISLGYIHVSQNITFNGSVIEINYTETTEQKHILTWTENTITLGDVTVEA